MSCDGQARISPKGGRLVPEDRCVKPEASCGMQSEPREQREGGGGAVKQRKPCVLLRRGDPVSAAASSVGLGEETRRQGPDARGLRAQEYSFILSL